MNGIVDVNVTKSPAPPRQRVFDVGDPAKHGKIVNAGPEVSEVRFDDGAVRYVGNDYLRDVEVPADGFGQPNPSATDEIVRRGKEALDRKRRSFDDWLLIGEAHLVGRTQAMHVAQTNKPTGKRYEKVFAEWLLVNSFHVIDKCTRNNLFECLKHRTEIEKWRAILTEGERFPLNHPTSVLRKWKASTVVPDPNAPPKISAFAKLKVAHVEVQEKLYRAEREIARGGGDLWSVNDRPKDIADIMIQKLGKTKAEKAAREIIKAIKEGPTT
jgi:hypothetical protein